MRKKVRHKCQMVHAKFFNNTKSSDVKHQQTTAHMCETIHTQKNQQQTFIICVHLYFYYYYGLNIITQKRIQRNTHTVFKHERFNQIPNNTKNMPALLLCYVPKLHVYCPNSVLYSYEIASHDEYRHFSCIGPTLRCLEFVGTYAVVYCTSTLFFVYWYSNSIYMVFYWISYVWRYKHRQIFSNNIVEFFKNHSLFKCSQSDAVKETSRLDSFGYLHLFCGF